MLVEMIGKAFVAKLREEAEKAYAEMDLDGDGVKDKLQIEATLKRIEEDIAKVDAAVDDKLLLEALADLAKVAGNVQVYVQKAKANLEKKAAEAEAKKK